MNWLRSKAKKLSVLALFALAVQLGLSFGHTHHDRAFAAKATISSQTSASSPSSNNDRDTDGRQDLCAICATVALANALIDSVPPVLPLPLEATASDGVTGAVTSETSTHPLGFQSRAPPVV